jgi:hypothetical protein
MKNKTLIIICVVASTILVLSAVGYFMNRKSVPSKANGSSTIPVENPTNGKKPDVTSASPTNPVVAPVPVPAPAPLSLTAGNAKRYANAKYGFSLLMPKDFWYEENGEDWGVGPVFTLALEHSKLKPEVLSHPNGTTTLSKYGQLMFVSVCDRSLKRGKCLVDGKIDGMDFKQQTTAILGGLPAQKFDDQAYTVVTDSYEYEITLNPALADALSTDELNDVKRAFENVVKTIWFD